MEQPGYRSRRTGFAAFPAIRGKSFMEPLEILIYPFSLNGRKSRELFKGPQIFQHIPGNAAAAISKTIGE
jgi:hypothetical protein